MNKLSKKIGVGSRVQWTETSPRMQAARHRDGVVVSLSTTQASVRLTRAQGQVVVAIGDLQVMDAPEDEGKVQEQEM